jgi:hypothetical protein
VQYQKLTVDFQNDLAASGLKAAEKKAAASAIRQLAFVRVAQGEKP